MSTSETQSASIKELHRSRDERILAGVAGGLGRYFDITPTFFRIGFAILALVGGAGILLYVAAWLVIPDEGESGSIVSEALRRRRDRPWLLAGVALVAIALVSLFGQADFWPNSGFAWTLLLLGALAIMLAQRRAADRTAPDDSSTLPDVSAAPARCDSCGTAASTVAAPARARRPAGCCRCARPPAGGRRRRPVGRRARGRRDRRRRRGRRRGGAATAHGRPRCRRSRAGDARDRGLGSGRQARRADRHPGLHAGRDE